MTTAFDLNSVRPPKPEDLRNTRHRSSPMDPRPHQGQLPSGRELSTRPAHATCASKTGLGRILGPAVDKSEVCEETSRLAHSPLKTVTEPATPRLVAGSAPKAGRARKSNARKGAISDGHAPNSRDESTPDALKELASKINAAHQQSVKHAAKANERAVEAGELLLQAKSRVQHGEWQPWLKKNITVSRRHAQRYMLLAEHRDELDRLNPGWMQEWSLGKALSRLTKKTADQEPEDEDRPTAVRKSVDNDSTAMTGDPTEAANSEAADEGNASSTSSETQEPQPAPDEPGNAGKIATAGVPATRGAIDTAFTPVALKKFRALEGLRVLKFQPASREQEAVDQLATNLVENARRLARNLGIRELAGFDPDVVALALVKRVIVAGQTSKLFQAG
jgi:hypothetical protein